MEDWQSAYSEPWRSELSLDYFTACEDNASTYSRSLTRSVSHVEDPETACHVKLQETSNTCERSDEDGIIHMLYMLNDCIGCTNLFVKEREEQGFSKKIGCCSKKRKDLYSSEDVRKELNYIENSLEKLQEKALCLLERVDPLLHETFVADLKSSAINDSESLDNVSNDEKSQLVVLYAPKKFQSNGILTEMNTKESVLFEQKFGDRNLPAIQEEGCETKETAANNMNGHNKTYVFSDKEHFRETANGDSGVHFADVPVSIAYLGEINLRVDLYKKYIELNAKISVANRLLGFLAKDGALDGQIKSMAEFLVDRNSKIKDDVQLTSAPRNKCVKFWNPFRVRNVNALLFEKEKWRIEVVQRNGRDPLEHLCGIALPLQYESFKSDTRATYYGIKRKNLLSISLQTADMTETITKNMFQKLFSLFMLLLSIALYFSDLTSDLILAGDHYSRGNNHYGALTLVFVFAPLMAETLSKLILKALGWDKEYGKLKWKDVFNFNDFKIVKWMASSFTYAVNTLKDYQLFAPSYAQLHAYRCRKGKKECTSLATSVESDSTYIHMVYSSMLAWNERFTLQTKLAESLNEAAPQLLLQLVIVIRQFMAGDFVGFKSWISIVTSVLSLSWSIHLSHFNRHYVEGGKVLNNPYTWTGRIMEFIGNCFIYGSRLMAICLLTTALGVVAIAGFFVYLAAIYFVMITYSARKEIYKTLHRYKTTIFWPLHRMFTVPYRIGIWRMDSLDHLLFYLEIICMAVSLPFLMPAEVDSKISWIITGSVLIGEAIGVALLSVFRRFFHPYGYVCENR